MPTFIKSGFWEKTSKGFKGWLNLDDLIKLVSGSFASLIGNPSDNIALKAELDSKLEIATDSIVLTDAAIIDLTANNQTLTSSNSTRTFIISYLGDDLTIEVILNNTVADYTFPETSLCVSEGIATGNNILPLSGTSGDRYIIAIKKIGTIYYVVGKNFGQ